MATLREYSKQNWNINSSNVNPTAEEINLGSLQRIADATEIMANNYGKLIEERDRYRRWYETEAKQVKNLENRIRSLKGANTRLKNTRK